MKTITQDKPNQAAHVKSNDNLIAVGDNYLTWRFSPGSLPGLSNLFPVLCDLKK